MYSERCLPETTKNIMKHEYYIKDALCQNTEKQLVCAMSEDRDTTEMRSVRRHRQKWVTLSPNTDIQVRFALSADSDTTGLRIVRSQ